MNFKPLSFLLAGMLLVGLAPRVTAIDINTTDFTLIVNVSDPSAVTFSGTLADALNSDTTHTFYDGIDLMGLFSSPAASLPNNLIPTVISTGLTTEANASPVYDSSYIDHITGGNEVDFNLYTRTMAALTTTETFSSSTQRQALFGTAIVDLSDYASILPAYGTTGEVFAGYSGENDPDAENPLVLIGYYDVIPEPSQWSLLLLGGAGLLVARRFRRSTIKA
jgi:hypothetical protein